MADEGGVSAVVCREVVSTPITSADDFELAFQRMTQAGAKGMINVPDSLLFQWLQRLAELALQHRFAAMIGAVEFADAGMLMA